MHDGIARYGRRFLAWSLRVMGVRRFKQFMRGTGTLGKRLAARAFVCTSVCAFAYGCIGFVAASHSTVARAASSNGAPFDDAGANPAFARVTPGHPLVFPTDRGAHPAYRTEWWYATGWLRLPDGRPMGFQITFFRSATGHDPADPSAFAPTQLIIAHAALSDPALGHLAHAQRTARQGFDLAYAREGDTDLKLTAWRMVRHADGRYQVTVEAPALSLHLTLTPTQPLMLQGRDGYSQKGPRPDEASDYYSEPHLQVTGFVGRAGDHTHAPLPSTAVTGSAWLDHEWSSTILDAQAVGWDWLGANLDDGSALMAFTIRGKDGRAIWAHAALRAANGAIRDFDTHDVTFTPLRHWRSPRTDTDYPIAQTVTTGTLVWHLSPLFDDQEQDSTQSSGSVYWEGAVRVTQDGPGDKHTGHGYLELTGYGKPMRFD